MKKLLFLLLLPVCLRAQLPFAETLPSGTSGQTLRHDGTSYVSSSVITNNGTNVGIGASPDGTYKLYTSGAAKFAGRIYATGTGAYSLTTSSNLLLENTTSSTGRPFYLLSSDLGKLEFYSTPNSTPIMSLSNLGDVTVSKRALLTEKWGASGSGNELLGRNSSGGLCNITLGSGLTLTDSTLSASGGGGSSYYQTLRDDGTGVTQRGKANFVSSSQINLALTDDSGNDETEVSATLAQNSATTGQVMKWDGSAWSPGTDNGTSPQITYYGNIGTVDSTYTWTKPAGATLIVVHVVGAGGGGGSGASQAVGTSTGGGGGGAGGGYAYTAIPAAKVGSTVTVTVPCGGAGGAGVTTGNGNNGTTKASAYTSFGSHVRAPGGANGGSGTTSGGGGGGSSTTWLQTGGSGSSGTATTAASNATSTVNFAASGGGGAGGFNAAGTNFNGGSGGLSSLTGVGASNRGVTPGGNATAGTAQFLYGFYGGQGGGGGAGNSGGTGGNGGQGAQPGGGGGGGGASLIAFSSGAGGQGGGGGVWIEVYF